MSYEQFKFVFLGYQKILTYKHADGSFSAFGERDGAGSMFLTAFVVRTLMQAKPYIYVDDSVIERAVKWIFEHQSKNGCFPSMNHLFQSLVMLLLFVMFRKLYGCIFRATMKQKHLLF